MPHTDLEFQPVVSEDGTIGAKPAVRDEHGMIIPDPSWVKFLKEMREGTAMAQQSNIPNAELAERFGYHKADATTGPLHAQLRAKFFDLAVEVNRLVPDGREKSLALTELQNSLMWANAAVAMTAPLVEE